MPRLKLVTGGPKGIRHCLNAIIQFCNRRERISAAYPIVVTATSDGCVISYAGDSQTPTSTVDAGAGDAPTSGGSGGGGGGATFPPDGYSLTSVVVVDPITCVQSTIVVLTQNPS